MATGGKLKTKLLWNMLKLSWKVAKEFQLHFCNLQLKLRSLTELSYIYARYKRAFSWLNRINSRGKTDLRLMLLSCDFLWDLKWICSNLQNLSLSNGEHRENLFCWMPESLNFLSLGCLLRIENFKSPREIQNLFCFWVNLDDAIELMIAFWWLNMENQEISELKQIWHD
jgi:hypothetical protein